MKHNTIRCLLSLAVLICMIFSIFSFQSCSKLGKEMYSDTYTATESVIHSDITLKNEETFDEEEIPTEEPEDEEEPEETEDTEPSYNSSSSGGSMQLKKFQTIQNRTDANNNFYFYAQGSCSDGNYLYVMINNDLDANFLSSLHKIDLKTGKTVKIVDGLKTGSSNDMTYNSKKGQIVITTNDPDKYRIVVLDAENLTVIEDKKLSKKVYSIAYDAQKDGYWLGLCGSYNFIFVDSNFNQKGGVYTGINTGNTKQGMECVNGYIYFLQTNQNSVVIYKNDGTYVTEINLPELNVTSAQSICYANGYFYIGCHVEYSGCFMYKSQITLK